MKTPEMIGAETAAKYHTRGQSDPTLVEYIAEAIRADRKAVIDVAFVAGMRAGADVADVAWAAGVTRQSRRIRSEADLIESAMQPPGKTRSSTQADIDNAVEHMANAYLDRESKWEDEDEP
jgi:hypothetical protein